MPKKNLQSLIDNHASTVDELRTRITLAGNRLRECEPERIALAKLYRNAELDMEMCATPLVSGDRVHVELRDDGAIKIGSRTWCTVDQLCEYAINARAQSLRDQAEELESVLWVLAMAAPEHIS